MSKLATLHVDAREIRAGDLIDRGVADAQLVRKVVRIRETTMSLPGLPTLPVTEIMHQRPDQPGQLAIANFPRGAKVRRVVL